MKNPGTFSQHGEFLMQSAQDVGVTDRIEEAVAER